MDNAEPVDAERFVGAMTGPAGRGSWPVASLEIRRNGEVRLQGSIWSWKLRPPPVVWQPGRIRVAENVRRALSSREGIRIVGEPGPAAVFWCDPRLVLAALDRAGVRTLWTDRPRRVRFWRLKGH
jgi:hypothetical protein